MREYILKVHVLLPLPNTNRLQQYEDNIRG